MIMEKITYVVNEVNTASKMMWPIYSTIVRDLAETVMDKSFREANSSRNFIVVDKATRKIVAYRFNAETKAKGANWLA